MNEESAVRHFGSLLLMALFYLLGTALYVLRIPERYLPGQFDILGNSHQLFHILTVVGTIVHYLTVFELANHRMQSNAGPSFKRSIIHHNH
jgi:predicted membrane channel-forming protein YqfA (hemolysin III family)